MVHDLLVQPRGQLTVIQQLAGEPFRVFPQRRELGGVGGERTEYGLHVRLCLDPQDLCMVADWLPGWQ